MIKIEEARAGDELSLAITAERRAMKTSTSQQKLLTVNSGASLVAQWRMRVRPPLQEPWGLTPEPQRPPRPQGD